MCLMCREIIFIKEGGGVRVAALSTSGRVGGAGLSGGAREASLQSWALNPTLWRPPSSNVTLCASRANDGQAGIRTSWHASRVGAAKPNGPRVVITAFIGLRCALPIPRKCEPGRVRQLRGLAGASVLMGHPLVRGEACLSIPDCAATTASRIPALGPAFGLERCVHGP